MAFDQKTRSLRIKGLGGDDEFVLTSFSGTEAVSRLFLFQIEFMSTNLKLTAKDVIGKAVTIEVAEKNVGDRGDADVRYFHGHINRFSSGSVSPFKGGEDEPSRLYTAEVVPAMWFLTQTARSHIFFPEKEEKSIYEVVEDVLNRSIHADLSWDGSHANELKSRKVKHCVQYRETDFNFVSRMLEQFGAYFYFEHADGSHKLIISTQPTTSTCRESDAEFRPNEGRMIRSWLHSFEFVSGEYEHADYNFETPLDDLKSNSPKIGELVPDVSGYQIYDYPGEFSDKGEGESEARIRQEEEETSHSVVQGSSGYRSFSTGYKFKLTFHPEEESQKELGEYMLTSIQHFASEPFLSGEQGAEYSNSFSCIPAAVRYRPPRVTPKPVISGVQTAVVTGPAGEEIYTDEYGRIKVCFHWDRETKGIKDSEGENCSCWVRVAQAMAGRRYGFMALPRINQEVVIEYEEGDPDRPLCVGSVYNDDQPHHYDPTEHKTRTYFKTNSSPGGEGFNELFFEDKADQEMIFLHAEKDLDTRVKECSREHIGGNMHLIVGKDEADGGNVQIDIEKHLKRTVGSDGIEFTNDGDEKRLTSGSHHLSVTGDWNSHASNISQEADMDINSKAGMNYAIEAGMNAHIKAGMSMVVESGIQLTLQAGGSSIVIDPSGVTIKGPMVTIDGLMVKIASGPGSPPGSGSGCSPTAPEEPSIAEPDEAHREESGQTSSN